VAVKGPRNDKTPGRSPHKATNDRAMAMKGLYAARRRDNTVTETMRPKRTFEGPYTLEIVLSYCPP